MMHTISAGDAHKTPVDCAKRVPMPVDVVPIRSSQSVHSVLANWFAGRIIVEIGTRNGDGMHCFAQVAHDATAIEIDKAYCRLLEKRSSELREGGHGYKVVCGGYDAVDPEVFAGAHFITWWFGSGLNNNLRVLKHLYALRHALHPGAQAVVMHDASSGIDNRSLVVLQQAGVVSNIQAVPIGTRECAMCTEALRLGKIREDRRVTCGRAAGAMHILTLRINNNPNLGSLLQRPLRSDHANLKASLRDTYPRSCLAGETRVKAPERRASRRRALVATYGVASRSALITWSSVERNVISPLQADGFNVTVFSFDLRIGGSRIDGVNACRSSDVVRCNVCEVDEQARLDLELAHKMEDYRLRKPGSHHLFSVCSSPWARRQYTGTGMSCFNNSLRQLHIENRVAAHLKRNGAKYDVAVALSVDYYIAMPIRLEHVREAASANASSNVTVYVTSVNDSGGYTDGLRSRMRAKCDSAACRPTCSMSWQSLLSVGALRGRTAGAAISAT